MRRRELRNAEVKAAAHEWDPVPVVPFGGRNLGVAGGQFLRFPRRPHNDMWLTVASALGVSVDALAGEKMLTGPYDGVLDGVLTT